MTLSPIQTGTSFGQKTTAPRTAAPANTFDTLVSAGASEMSGQKSGKNPIPLDQNYQIRARVRGVQGDRDLGPSLSSMDELSQTFEEQKKTAAEQENEGGSVPESSGLKNGATPAVMIEMKMRGLSWPLTAAAAGGIAATTITSLPGTALKADEAKRNDRGETPQAGLDANLLLLGDAPAPRHNGAAQADELFHAAALFRSAEKETKSASDGRIGPDLSVAEKQAEQVDGKLVSWFESAGKFQESIATAVKAKLGELSSPDGPAPVLQATRDATSGGIRELRLRLHPADFGQLSVHLQNRGDSMRIVVHSQTTAAHARLVAEKDELRRSLEVQGVSVKEIIFRAPNDTSAATAVAQNSEPSGLTFGQPERRPTKNEPDRQSKSTIIQLAEDEASVVPAKISGKYI